MILVSLCLLGVACRYDGKKLKRRKFLLELSEPLLPLCPEQLGGLPTPRKKMELQGKKVVNEDGEDVTPYLIRGAKICAGLVKLFNIKEAYLKSKSPSCGKEGITTQMLKKSKIKINIVD